MKWVSHFTLICCMVTVMPVLAQTQTVERGDRVKIEIPSQSNRFMIGTVLERSPTELRLSTGDYIMNVPVNSIKQLYVNTGKQSQIRKSVLIVGGIGFVSGGIVGFASAKNCEIGLAPTLRCPEEFAAVTGAFIGAGIGTLVGALIGSKIKTERWEKRNINILLSMPDLALDGISLNPAINFKFTINNRMH